METHHFRVADAVRYGLYPAIILQHIRTVQQNNQDNPLFLHNGRYYAHIRTRLLHEKFPYMGESSISGWLRELEDAGILLREKLHTKGWNHTRFYFALDSSMQVAEPADQGGEIEQESKFLVPV